jgi:DNA-binding MltR family transcriptional regulator
MITVDYHSILHKEFETESDRAAVIVAASILDELLRSFLVAKLVPVSSSSDDLFDGSNAPLGTFSSRIEMAFRVGLVSVKFARDLHLVRKIRNDFAHTIHGASFEDTRVKNRVSELDNSNGIYIRNPKTAAKETTTRAHFLQAVGWMIYHLERSTTTTKSFQACSEEWGYSFNPDNPIDDKSESAALDN